ncbi:MAG: hypothetical protein JWM27_1254 [Gemmatimonadetes bacterium]|nr:hypothetical protein [Gemmatimonadota bacterium]
MPRIPLFRLLAAAALLLAPAARAQGITIRGDDRSRAADIAREVVARNTFLRIDRDTVLPATFHASGDLVVVGPTEVKLEGQVDGSVAVLGGQLYLRPGSRVGGAIGVLGGGVYPSARAQYDEISEANTATSVQIRRDTAGVPRDTADDADRAARDSASAIPPGRDSGNRMDIGVDVTAPSQALRVQLRPSPLPAYNRVDGGALSLGAAAFLRGDEQGPAVQAWATVRQYARPGAGARVHLPFWRREAAVEAEASRGTRTNDAWQIGDLANSAAALLGGSDYRDYYDADRASLTLLRPYLRPLISPESWLGPRAGVIMEKDRSRRERATWSLVGGGGLKRLNPPIDSGTLVSAFVGVGYKKRWPTSRFDGDAQAERGIAAAGDFGFTQVTVDGTYQATVLRLHQLTTRFHVMLPLGGDGAPRQRWAVLGGATTLPTLAVARFRGDHLLYVASSYAIPIQQVTLPFIGQPSFELWHAAGTAWATGDKMPSWTHNLGAGVAFPLLHARVVIDPGASPIRFKGVFWVSLPGT